MKRRTYLSLLAAGSLAGCSAAPTADTAARGGPASTPAEPVARRGHPPDICGRTPTSIGISAINGPAFAADWSTVADTSSFTEDGGLPDDATVVGVRHGDVARAYPLRILRPHEMVNDTIEPSPDGGGESSLPLVATFCPLCNSGLVAKRVVDGQRTIFGVSGLLWRPPGPSVTASEAAGRTFGIAAEGNADERVQHDDNLVMVDAATGSYWSQLLAEAICGPRRGDRLEIVPSSATTWGAWRDRHPETGVLLPPPHSSTYPRGG